jgi:hypothetical protein
MKLPRSQSSQIKHMIYPERKMDKAVHQKNLKDLKLKQDINKQRREEKENTTPGIK